MKRANSFENPEGIPLLHKVIRVVLESILSQRQVVFVLEAGTLCTLGILYLILRSITGRCKLLAN